MASGNKKEPKRLHFSAILSILSDRCQQDVWSGITRYARTNDIHLTAYIGAHKTSNYDKTITAHLETCFESIIHDSSLDGVILFGGFLAQIVDIDTIMEYVARIPKHIPVVSLTLALPGIPSVMADDFGGIYSAVDHLIQTHGKKKIAFIKGPEGQEVEERFRGYRQALAANDIAFDERYVFPGLFTTESGCNAVCSMLDDRRLSADAIVAASDEIAVGALTELKKRNIMVPGDIAVTGFDDDIYSAVFNPSISTAKLDFSMIGQVAAETLQKIITGKPVEDMVHVSAVFEKRQSCGCTDKSMSINKPVPDSSLTEAGSLKEFVMHEFTTLLYHEVPKNITGRLVTGLVDAITKKPFNKSTFLFALENILTKYSRYSNNYSRLSDALNVLVLGVEHYRNDVEAAVYILSTLAYAATLVGNARLKEGKLEEFNLIDYRTFLREMISNLVLIFDLKSLADELLKSLTELSIGTVLVGLYHGPIRSDDRDTPRVIDTVVGFDDGTRLNIEQSNHEPILFSDYSTIGGFDFEHERRTLFFLPLFFKDEETGALVLSYDPQIPEDVYETLRVNISTAVKGADLMSRIQTLSITDELTGLLNRRGFLQFVNSRSLHLRRTGATPIVMFMDMDGLKKINDEHGHCEGDKALSTFADILRNTLREEDIVGRMGGDEFAILSSVRSNENVEMLKKRIRANLAAYNAKKHHPYEITVSIGSVVLEESTKECFDAALLCADSILYEEKMKKKKEGLSRQE